MRNACICKYIALDSVKIPRKKFTMYNELIFSVASMMAILGWLLLLASPFIPSWSDRLAGYVIPLVLSVGYIALLLTSSGGEGGYGSLADVMKLFTYEQSVLAGWIHFLAFDLFIGAWICREARLLDIKFWLVVPSLFLTFLFGPAGLLIFIIFRAVGHRNMHPTISHQ